MNAHFSFSSGPAGLLSPLQTTTRSDNLVCSSLLSAHQNGGRASEMLAGLRRHHPYIKEEVPNSFIKKITFFVMKDRGKTKKGKARRFYLPLLYRFVKFDGIF